MFSSFQFATNGAGNQLKAQRRDPKYQHFNMRFLLLPLIVGVATSKSIRASSISDGNRILQANEIPGFQPLSKLYNIYFLCT